MSNPGLWGFVAAVAIFAGAAAWLGLGRSMLVAGGIAGLVVGTWVTVITGFILAIEVYRPDRRVDSGTLTLFSAGIALLAASVVALVAVAFGRRRLW